MNIENIVQISLEGEKIMKKMNAKKRAAKRNRFMAVVALVVLTIVIGIVAGQAIVKAENQASNYTYTKTFKSVCVETGDTLWSISSKYMDSAHYDSVYDHMDEVISMNHLTSKELKAGQVIMVPYYMILEE